MPLGTTYDNTQTQLITQSKPMEQHQDKYENDEITLKELLYTIKEYWFELWRRWYIIGLLALPVAGYFIYKHYQTPTTFKAETKFIIEGSSSGGGLSSLLGQFGFGGGSTSKINPFKVQEVAKSKTTWKKLMFNKAGKDFIANRIIEVYEFDKIWEKGKDKSLVGFRFKNGDSDNFSDKENKILVGIIGKIVGAKESKEESLFSINFDEDSGIFSLTSKTKDEDLTLALVDQSYKHLKTFFEEELMGSQYATAKLLKSKADSIQRLITSKTYASAAIEDKSLGLISNVQGVQSAKLQKEAMVLGSALAEIIKSYEMSDINLQSSRPLFLTIDEAIPPLEPQDSSMLISLIKGCLLGGILGATFVIGRKVVLNALEGGTEKGERV